MPELTKLGQVLHEEHFHILVEICGLESRVTGDLRKLPLDPNRDDDRLFLEELVNSIEGVIDHHVFEECVIFPLISDYDDSELAILLSREHGAIEPMARRLRAMAETMLQDGTSPALWEGFCTAAVDLIAEVLRHLQKEEQCIVQRLALLLDPETDSRLAHRLSLQRLDPFTATTDALADPHNAAGRGCGPLPSRRTMIAAAAARAAARRRSSLTHHTAR